MSRAYSQMMPFLILNLGVEMMYVIEMRLKEINPETMRKVLYDTIMALLKPQFMDEVFRTQKMYTLTSVKKIF